MTEYDAVLLDLDGTLCEYRRGTAELLALAFEAAGVDPLFSAADYHAIVDDYADRAETFEQRRELCFAALAEQRGADPAVGRAVAEAYTAERDQHNVRFLDGAVDLLDALTDRPLALVTNGGPDIQDPKIESLGIRDRFETVVYASYDTAAKPDAEPFEVALARLGVDAGRAVYVGDTYGADVVGAAEAGLDAVMVGDLPDDAPVEPVATVATPGELVGRL